MRNYRQIKYLPLFLLLCGCFTASQPTAPTSNPCPACPGPITIHDTIQKIVVKTVTVDDTDIIDIKTSDTITMPTHDTVRLVYNTPIYVDSSGSQDVYVHLTPGADDNSLELQTQIDAIDFNTGTTNIHCHVNHGFFTFKHGILFHNWQLSRGVYFPFTIDLEGDGTAASADGSGTTFYFPITDNFWIGFQGAKGCKFHGITLEGIWSPQYTSMYDFYCGKGMDAAIMRDDNFSPSAAVVFDPFGPQVPAGGGYPGTDAYGKPWVSYYRGSGNGSTGCQVYDIKFIGSWIGIITSPNGQTANAEAMHFYNLNFDISNAYPIVGCQAQEKQNEIGPGIIDWGATAIFFKAAGYGAHEPGNWEIHGVNIAGPVWRFVNDNTGGYYPINIHDCFGETLGGFGYLGGQMHNSVSRCHFDFANPVDAAFQYLGPQIDGCNTTYRDCNFRFYGMPLCPIQISNHDGWNVMDNCGFDAVPVYNQYSGGGTMPFRDCSVWGELYTQMSGQWVAIDSTLPNFEPTYQINDSLVGKYYQATIKCQGNEQNGRIYVQQVLVAFDEKAIQVGIAGVITAIDPNRQTFTLCYIPSQIIPGQRYYLRAWKQNLIQ